MKTHWHFIMSMRSFTLFVPFHHTPRTLYEPNWPVYELVRVVLARNRLFWAFLVLLQVRKIVSLMNNFSPFYVMKYFSFLTIVCMLLSQAVAQSVTTTCPAGYSQSMSFPYTGSEQMFTVPAGVTSIYLNCLGASGAAGDGPGGGAGGAGAQVSGLLSVTPGEVLYLYVGGAGVAGTGGFNGGGNGGSNKGGGGGGATDVRQGGNAASNRIAIAGGGGGGGATGCDLLILGGKGGNSNTAGLAGADAPTPNTSPAGNAGGGAGGTVGAGGAAGIGCGGFLGSPGTIPDGGAGQTCCCFSTPRLPGGGGGGGGFVQGGGGGGGSAGTTGCSGNDKGAGGGGAGGSSSTSGLTGATVTDSANVGDGSVTICYCVAATQPIVGASAQAICPGESVTFTVTAGSLNGSQDWAWYDAANNKVGTGATLTVSPASATTYSVRGEGGCAVAAGQAAMVSISIHTPAQITVNAPAALCEGAIAIITASGAATYLWSTGENTASITASAGTYSVSGVDGNGCKDTTTVVIASNPLPQPVIVQPVSDLSTDPFAAYQWYVNDTLIVGATGQTYTPTKNGSYTVVVTAANGCQGTSAPFAVVNVSADLPLGWTLNIFPNPTVGRVEVETNQPRLAVSLIDAAGHTLNRIMLSEGTNSLDLSSLPAGTYAISFDYQGKRITHLISKL